MLDLGATSNFVQLADGFKLTGPSSKSVSTANGHIMKATHRARLPLTQLNERAREAIVIPEMSTQALMSVRQLADQGYTTIFILTCREPLSMTMTAVNLSSTNRRYSKDGGTIEDCGLYRSRKKRC